MLQTKTRPVYCVGWLGSEIPAYMPLWCPSVPKSYKSDEAKRGWLDDYMADAAVLPYVSEVSEVVVKDGDGKTVISTSDTTQFMKWANLVAGFSDMDALDSEAKMRAVFVGFNVKLLFQSVSAELWSKDVAVPFRFWHGTPGLFDINDLLIPGVLRNGFDVGSLLAFGANRYLPPEYQHLTGPGNAVMPNAEMRAVVVRALAKFAQLI